MIDTAAQQEAAQPAEPEADADMEDAEAALHEFLPPEGADAGMQFMSAPSLSCVWRLYIPGRQEPFWGLADVSVGLAYQQVLPMQESPADRQFCPFLFLCFVHPASDMGKCRRCCLLAF